MLHNIKKAIEIEKGESESSHASPLSRHQKAQPLYTGAMLNLRDRVLDEVERNSSLLFQVKGITVLKSGCPHLKRVVRSFIVKVQRARNDQLVDFLPIGWW